MPSDQFALDLPSGTDTRITWERQRQAVGARYLMQVGGAWNGWTVAHCGHPTAIRPYYVTGPQGQHFQAYRLLEEAKAVAIAESQTE